MEPAAAIAPSRGAMRWLAVAALGVVAVLAAWTPSLLVRSAPYAIAGPDGRIVASLEAIRAGRAAIPRIFPDRLPGHLHRSDDVEARKADFVAAVLPLVLAENERILEARARLVRIDRLHQQGRALTRREASWLADAARHYRVAPQDRAELQQRIDAVPVSLALAQAALETGWGSSRVSQDDRALFGEMLFFKDGSAPKVRPFADLPAAVRAYMHNLNTHRAYREFRDRRAAMRAAGAADGHALAGHLLLYSERGADYVREVQRLMLANGFRSFDEARLIR